MEGLCLPHYTLNSKEELAGLFIWPPYKVRKMVWDRDWNGQRSGSSCWLKCSSNWASLTRSQALLEVG